MAIDSESKRWGMLQTAAGPVTSALINPNGSDFDFPVERFTVLNIYGGNNAPAIISADSSGTATDVSETVIVLTGGTVDITLTNDTYIAAGTGPIGTTAQSNAFVAAFTAATSPTNGWNNTVRDVLDNTDLTRVSDTVARLTVPATVGYDPGITETITPVIQAAILTTSASDVNSSSFQITIVATGTLNVVRNVVSNVVRDAVR